jgi:hypothetical protein
MQRLLRVAWLIAVSATFAPPTEAQDAPGAGIVAPAPLTRPPISMAAYTPAQVVRIRSHSYAGSGTPIHPSLWVVNGRPLGLRSDGSIDRAAAQRELKLIRCRDVVSIDVLRDAVATTRFGPNVPDGVVLLVTRTPSAENDADGAR